MGPVGLLLGYIIYRLVLYDLLVRGVVLEAIVVEGH